MRPRPILLIVMLTLFVLSLCGQGAQKKQPRPSLKEDSGCTLFASSYWLLATHY